MANINGTTGNDTLEATGEPDIIRAGAGNDLVDGEFGGDLIYLEDGNDTVWGWIYTEHGPVTIHGGAGDDFVYADYWDSGALVYGGAGNDRLKAYAGRDTLDGGEGDDFLEGGNWEDVLTGGSGNDKFVWRASASHYDEPYGDDTITDFGNDSGLINDGDTTNNDFIDLSGIFNGDTLALYNQRYKTDFRSPLAALNHDLHDGKIDFYGEVGERVIWGWSLTFIGVTSLTYDQTGVLEDPGKEILGTFAADTIQGTVGSDTIHGLGGDDTIVGDYGDDLVYGSEGNDSLRGGSGLDTLDGGSGDDSLHGGADRDTLLGGDGSDTLDGRGGNEDLLAGGAGDDVYFIGDSTDTVFESARAGLDTVQSTVSCTLGLNVENLVLLSNAGLTGTGNALANLITGNGGNNMLSGLEGYDTLYGGAGRDTLDGGGRADLMSGGLGNDVYVVNHSKDQVIEAAGTDIDFVQSSVHHVLSANVENLSLLGSGALDGRGNDLANRIVGNSGANLLRGLEGGDTISGGDGNDTVLGGSENDLLDGGAGDDRLQGDEGQDSLTGGAGADSFIYRAGSDLINDFLDNVDTLVLDDTLWGGAALTIKQVLSMYASVAGGDAILTFGSGNTLTIENIADTSLLSNDILLV